MKLYNSLSRTVEELVPLDASGKKISIYTCGPTVYDYVTIGNWRTYTLSDLMVRTLQFFGYETDFVMNITDVGHLTGDNLGDSSSGEDRLEKGARREGKTAWEIADYYAKDFLAGYDQLQLTKPKKFTKATDYIEEQVRLVQAIEQRGLVYHIPDDGIYFDTQAYEAAGFTYGELSNIDQVKEGARVEPNPNKRDPRDFALWKFSPKDALRQMEWDSPWGVGFPGWHIECSAMIMAELGDQIDIHMGGEDLRSTHHPNEIAQSEAATGKHPFVKYWVHGAFLQVDGGRMGKSLGNAYTLHDLAERGFDLMALRYFYMTGHYRKPLNFTWEGLEAAETALNRLYALYDQWSEAATGEIEHAVDAEATYYTKFADSLADDLNIPAALGVLWEVVGDTSLTADQKKSLVDTFNRVFNFDLTVGTRRRVEEIAPEAILELVKKRDDLRSQKAWGEADQVRQEIEHRGYTIQDTPQGTVAIKMRGRSGE